jgi:hypothetical protein
MRMRMEMIAAGQIGKQGDARFFKGKPNSDSFQVYFKKVKTMHFYMFQAGDIISL